jgi:hypothetical protein
MTTTPVVDVQQNTVTHDGKLFNIRSLGNDTYNALIDGVPVGRLMYVFGQANGVPEGDSTVSEEVLNQIAEAWFAALG